MSIPPWEGDCVLATKPRECWPGDNGEYYDLIGDLQDLRDGAKARVIGFRGVRSRCGGQAIDVKEINR